MPRIARSCSTYGFNEDNDIRAVVCRSGWYANPLYAVLRKEREPLRVTVNQPGLHNVLNALAAIGIATDEGACLMLQSAVHWKVLVVWVAALRFRVTFEIEGGNVKLVDDYGHHPKEVEATIKAARQSHAGPSSGNDVPATPL